MNVATIANLDQSTIGPEDLRAFIEVLDDVSDAVGGTPAIEISHITGDLRVTLGKWHQCIARNTGCRSIDQTPDCSNGPAQDRIDFQALDSIDRHLSRLVLRHSNFGFAAANVPSELDRYFPQTALPDIRKAQLRLRHVVKELPAIQRTHTTVLSL